jgi:hypothetical protein
MGTIRERSVQAVQDRRRSTARTNRRTLWTGSFETGDLSPWRGVHALPDRILTTTNPVIQGSYAAGFMVRQGEIPTPPEGSNPRAEPPGEEEFEG